jgi:hypothetical protein
MSGVTEPLKIPVTAEWALWGKEPHDLEYRLLRYSSGTLNAANFDELITRYATGTLEDLPQVTISWFEDQRKRRHYVALAIHEEPEDRRLDATGRPVMLTRCFCVPYAALAQGLVSYQAMYDVFRQIPLDDRDDAITAELPSLQPGSRADASAGRAAALLLTCKPVCILGADRVGLAERLRFLDAVMSLLPYGLRSQLSASTWASSQYWEHKFRLFFATAVRPGVEEWDVTWGGDRRPVAPPVAEDYLSWLWHDAAAFVPQLAAKTDPVRFKVGEVDRLLSQLYDLPIGRRVPRMLPPSPVADEYEERSIEELLIDCDQRMRSNTRGIVEPVIERLAERRGNEATANQRQVYLKVIKDRELFREDKWLTDSSQAELYAALLGIAFELPLKYEGYCQLEDCVGNGPGQPIHRSLLLAATTAGIHDLLTKLLVLKGEGLDTALGDRATEAELIHAIVDPELRPYHVSVIYGIAVRDLLRRAERQRLNEGLLRSALAEQTYLGRVVEQIRPEPADRLAELRALLRLAYSDVLNRPAITAILGDGKYPPTNDLFFAVVAMTHSRDAEFAERTFIRRLALSYKGDMTDEFLRNFPQRDPRDVAKGSPRAAVDDRGYQRGLKRRFGFRKGPKQQGSHELRQLQRIQAAPRYKSRAAQVPETGGAKYWIRRAFGIVIVLVVLFILFKILHLVGLFG